MGLVIVSTPIMYPRHKCQYIVILTMETTSGVKNKKKSS